MLKLLVLMAAAVAAFGVQVSNALPASGASCEPARHLVASLRLAHSANESPVSGGGGGSGSGLVCDADRTCCPAGLEVALRQSAAHDFHRAVRQSSHHLRHSLAESAGAIQEQVVQHIRTSTVKTKTMFDQLYRRVAVLAGEPIERLFNRLESYASVVHDADTNAGADSSQIGEAVNAFFDELFPRLYGQSPRSVQGASLASLSPRLPADYVDCLKRVQSELRPFGEIPRRLAASLTKSLDAVKSLVSAVHLGVHVLNATDHAELNGQCKDALLRATYCAQCKGLAAPAATRSAITNGGGQVCRGLCSNVARGCLAAVADVDQPWNEWIDAMERLTLALLNKHGHHAGGGGGELAPHEILSSVDSRLSEAVLYALENAPLLEKKAKKICGGEHLANVTSTEEHGAVDSVGVSTGSTGGGVATPSDKSQDLSPVLEGAGQELKSRIESLASVLATARGFYSNLPDAVCAQPGTPFQAVMGDDQSNCWNGQRFAEYTKPISGIGIGAQKYNAEVRVSRSDVDSHLVQLSDRLRHVRQVLVSKTVPSSPEPESLVMADFGSGSGDGGAGRGGATSRNWDGTDDDSDNSFTDPDMEASGSGHGPREFDDDNKHSTTGKTKQQGKDDIEVGGDTTPSVYVPTVKGGDHKPASGSTPLRTSLVAMVTCLAMIHATILFRF